MKIHWISTIYQFVDIFDFNTNNFPFQARYEK